METTVNVSPASMATGAAAEARSISPEAADIVARMKDYYRENGKAAAAANYSRHLKSFFAWNEAQGYTIKSLPADSVEGFLSALAASGQRETTLYVTRTQLKSALRDANTLLGLDVGHLEYVAGKPPAVKQKERAKEKQRRAAKRDADTLAQAAAIQAGQAVLGIHNPTVSVKPSKRAAPAPVAPAADVYSLPTPQPYEEYPMSEPTTPPVNGVAPTGAVPAPATAPTTIINANLPPAAANPNGQRGTLANPPGSVRTVGQNGAQPQRGVVINNHTFTGSHVKISYVADGSNPFTPPGTEVALTSMPASQLAPHGDLSAFLQTHVIPTMRLSPNSSEVHFVFYELNDRRQPTGRRDELIVSVPLNFGAPAAQQNATSLNGIGFGGPQRQDDAMSSFLLKKLDEEAAEAKKRAEDYQQQLREAKDAQTTFMLMQSFQKEQDLRKELEERRDREAARLSAPPPPVPTAMPPMAFPPMPLFPPEPPKADTTLADALRAMSEQNARTMEVLAAAMKPQPVAAPKDTAEWLVPFMGQMQQQAQAQAAAQQQMMLTIMQGQATQQAAAAEAQRQASQQMMQLMMNKESATEKILMMQLQKAEAQASSPKEDELESFADKLQKMKMVSDMMGGGGGGSLLTELLANADTIGAGAAKIIDAAKGNGALAGSPTAAVAQEQRQIAGAPALPASAQGDEFPKPSAAVMEAHKVFAKAVDDRDDTETANAFLAYLKELVTAQEPYASMGQRLMKAFQQAEDEGELYTLAKNLWIVVGEKSMRPHAKYAARVLAENYTALHQSIFEEPRTLPEDEELEAEEGVEGEEEEAA